MNDYEYNKSKFLDDCEEYKYNFTYCHNCEINSCMCYYIMNVHLLNVCIHSFINLIGIINSINSNCKCSKCLN